MSFEITPQSTAVGAYVTGLDLSKPLYDAVFERLHAAYLEHHVLCFREQVLSPAQHLAFAGRWGKVSVHPYVASIPGHPGLMEIGDPHPITVEWHSDTTHAATPPRTSMLLARRVPERGGDTLWASQHAAFDTLSPALQEMLQGLRAVHRGTEMAGESGLSAREVTAVHPVVRRHPETSRPALYVNADYTKHFEGMTEEESRPLLEFLYAWAARSEYRWRHHWRVGDLVMWDNASVQHSVVPDVEKGERLLHRVTLEGEVPR